jgi:oligoendopeptidase F
MNGKILLCESSEKGLMKREEIAEKYKWNLKDIYADEDLWEKDFEYIKSKIDEYKNFDGTIGQSATSLLKMIEFDEDVNIKYERLHLYSFLSKDLDLANSKYQAMSGRLQDLGTKLSNATAFIRPELIAIGKDKIFQYLSENEGLANYKHYFDDMFRTAEHSLDKDKEELLSLTMQMRQTAYQTFGYFKNADIKYPSTKDSDGNDIEISEGRYYSALFSKDRAYRERVYKGYYAPIIEHRNTLSALFNGNIHSQIFIAKARKFASTREAALKANNIPLSVYDNLVKTVNENFAPLHRWAAIKKKVLGLDKIHAYDSYVSIFDSAEKKYSYDDGVRIAKDTLQVLGDEYMQALNTAFDNRWIDVYETKGKRGGAYSSGTSYGVHPYVLLNWNHQMNDVSTLVHEMGHNMHSYFTEKYQPYVYADYPIFLAEVASITNEALLMEYLISHSQSKLEKLNLIEMYLNKIVTTFYRQTRFAEFEQLTHEKTEAGESLTPDDLCKLYSDMYQKYWGPDMVVDEEEAYTWARVPHFYYGFYVFQYATGLAAAELIAKNVKDKGQVGVDSLMQFLKAGKSKYAIDILKDAGVDMTKPEPVNAVISTMNRLLDELEAEL